MADSQLGLLKQEWQILHQGHERNDRYCLIIKLCAVIVCLVSLAQSIDVWPGLVLILVLWLQEGIWRTQQARTGERLLIIERLIAEPSTQAGMQFYSDWEATRPGTLSLIKEYMRHAIRPTVAYPYIGLVGIEILFNYCCL